MLFVIIHSVVTAAPYDGDLFSLKQPDGSYVSVNIWGDEFHQRVESLDGHTLVRNPETGWICYAELSRDKSLLVATDTIYTGTNVPAALNTPKHIDISSEAIAQRVTQAREELLPREDSTVLSASGEAAAAQSPTGAILGLTLLVEFPDEPATIPRSEIENYLNERGYSNYGNNGSVRDYFYDVSGGTLDYTNYVTDYYTAQNNKTYYTDPNVSVGVRARGLVREALVWLEGRGFDFSTLSTDSEDYILAINCLYAGHVNSTWGSGLWPHKGQVYPEFQADGVTSRYYQISNIGSSLTLRTFCHENGHMLFGWSDLYDTGHNSYGIGNYGLMGYGGSNLNPVPPNPMYRAEAGWTNLIDVTDSPSGTVFSHSANSQTAYRYSHPLAADEYFLIESRVKSDRNAALPDEGLLIWHIDESMTGNIHEQMTAAHHYKVSVEQADGLFELENRVNTGGQGDLFHGGYITVFDGSTWPSSEWWSGMNSGFSIHSIVPTGPTMTFSFCQLTTDFDLKIVDDMESYTAVTYRIGDTWLLNSTGALVVVATGPCWPVHDGGQSMAFHYDNNYLWDSEHYHSAIEASTSALSVGSDWTGLDAKVLELHFYGDPTNDANDTEQMYVAIEDGSGHYSEARYPELNMNDIKVAEWQSWSIVLEDFNEGGVNLEDVNKVCIGFGNRDNSTEQGGYGLVFFDDIRLHPTICRMPGPMGDLNCDCIVNNQDLEILSANWGENNLGASRESPVGWWALDEGQGYAVSDSSGNESHGTAEGIYSWTIGHVGPYAGWFSGGRVLIPDAPALRVPGELTVSVWINYLTAQWYSARVIGKGADDQETLSLEIEENDTVTFSVRDVIGTNHSLRTDSIHRNEWIHLAGMRDGSSMRLYVNCQEVATRFGLFGADIWQDDNPLVIGNRLDDTNYGFVGSIDDVRLYDYCLTAQQVSRLSGCPVVSSEVYYSPDLYPDYKVNFSDYAILMSRWLDDTRWPGSEGQ